MPKSIIVMWFLSGVLSLEGPDINYCKFPCSKQIPHTICALKHNCEMSSRCKNFTNLPFSEEEKQEIVDIHNDLRNKIALGLVCKSIEGKTFPKAAAMRELVWDKDLEFQVQCWANQCLVKHDQCRRKYDGQLVGQNLAWTNVESIETTLHRFFDECEKTPLAAIDNWSFDGPYIIGHFGQFAWWNTSQVGCARAQYIRPGRDYMRVFIGCNYAWKGLANGQHVYPTGAPCDRCPKDSMCHQKYKGLCTTEPSKSMAPNICKFAANKIKCDPFLSLDGTNQSYGDFFLSGTNNEMIGSKLMLLLLAVLKIFKSDY